MRYLMFVAKDPIEIAAQHPMAAHGRLELRPFHVDE